MRKPPSLGAALHPLGLRNTIARLELAGYRPAQRPVRDIRQIAGRIVVMGYLVVVLAQRLKLWPPPAGPRILKRF